MYRTASYPRALPAESSVLSQRSFALGAALMLVSLSYLLLLAVPAVSRNLRSLSDGYGVGAADSWLPIASVSGLALGGGAALLFVLMQIAREAAQRPYVALAPVLAAFSVCIMIGLRAPLPLPGVAAEHVAVFALAVSVVGGALVQEPGVASRLAGLAFTLLPSLSLMFVVWTVSGKSDPWLALWSLPSATRAYLTMLAVSSSAIALLAVLGRRLSLAESPAEPGNWSLAAQADAMMAEAYERSYAADEAALARRGLPTWLVASLSAAAVVAGFFALKVYLDGRAKRPPVALVGSTQQLPIQVDPQVSGSRDEAQGAQLAARDIASQPTVTALALPNAAVAPVPTLPAAAAPFVEAVEAAAAAEVIAPSVQAQRPVERQMKIEAFSSPREPARSARRSARRSQRVAPALAEKSALRSAPEKAAVSAQAAEKPEPVATQKLAKVEEASAPAAAAKPTAKAPAEPSLASRLLAKPAEKAAPDKPIQTRGDESLDELMDNVVKSKRGKSAVGAGDDPIFGL